MPKRKVDADGNAYTFGPGDVLVERGLPTAADQEPLFYVYRKKDTKADKDTLLDFMWDEVGTHKTEEAAHAAALKLVGE